MKRIDVHAHLCPVNFPSAPAGNMRWPCMCDSGLMLGSEMFRKLDARSWDISRRLDDMGRAGVTMQVLSPMPELLSYWFSVPDAEVMADFVNGAIAEMIASAPASFRGLGMAPLQAPLAAARYLTRVKETFGLAGVQVGTHIAGVQLGDKSLEPFWEAAAALDLAVFIHPLHPLTTKLENVPPLFHPLAGFPLDTAIAGASLLLSGTLARHPALRIGLSHGGGAMPQVLQRLDQAWACMPAFRQSTPQRPSETASRLFYDSNVYDPIYLAYLATNFAPGRIFLGTDYPYEIMQQAPAHYLARTQLPEAALASLAFGAAEAFLG